MADAVGNGNSQFKIDAAKQAAIAAVDRAARNGAVEIAVLAFEGECSDPVPRQTGFSSDFGALQRFIAALQPGGGTPMAQAMLAANRFMQSDGSANARDRMIVLVADAESFARRPLADFRIAIPASPYDVEVCIRDHECEDGDRVRVSVNGIELMSEEIVNAWMCRTVPLGEGRHDIELFAVNGTGFKGEDCSHADANTGEIRVTGEDTQTQSWRHRGGAGSSAGIEVTVR